MPCDAKAASVAANHCSDFARRNQVFGDEPLRQFGNAWAVLKLTDHQFRGRIEVEKALSFLRECEKSHHQEQSASGPAVAADALPGSARWVLLRSCEPFSSIAGRCMLWPRPPPAFGASDTPLRHIISTTRCEVFCERGAGAGRKEHAWIRRWPSRDRGLERRNESLTPFGLRAHSEQGWPSGRQPGILCRARCPGARGAWPGATSSNGGCQGGLAEIFTPGIAARAADPA